MTDTGGLGRQAEAFYGAITAVVRGCARVRALLQGQPTEHDRPRRRPGGDRPRATTSPEGLGQLTELFRLQPVGLARARAVFTDAVRELAAAAHRSGAVLLGEVCGGSYAEIAIQVAVQEVGAAPLQHLIDYLDSPSGLLDDVCLQLGRNPFVRGAGVADGVAGLAEEYGELLRGLELESAAVGRQFLAPAAQPGEGVGQGGQAPLDDGQPVPKGDQRQSRRERVVTFITEIFYREGRVPSAREVYTNLGIPKSSYFRLQKEDERFANFLKSLEEQQRRAPRPGHHDRGGQADGRVEGEIPDGL